MTVPTYYPPTAIRAGKGDGRHQVTVCKYNGTDILSACASDIDRELLPPGTASVNVKEESVVRIYGGVRQDAAEHVLRLLEEDRASSSIDTLDRLLVQCSAEGVPLELVEDKTYLFGYAMKPKQR